MLDKKIIMMLNDQVNYEMYSAYIYHKMKLAFEDMGLRGYARWYDIQTREEIQHAERIENFLMDSGEKVCLKSIEEPVEIMDDVEKMLKQALKHEKSVTCKIHAIYKETIERKDIVSMEFLNWFISEQVEEEKNARDNIQLYHNYIGCSCGLMNADKKMSQREEIVPIER